MRLWICHTFKGISKWLSKNRDFSKISSCIQK